jgi:hypothetical protein
VFPETLQLHLLQPLVRTRHASHLTKDKELQRTDEANDEGEEGECRDRPVVIKNWDPLVLGPALAIDNKLGLVCFNLKFSSGNFSP